MKTQLVKKQPVLPYYILSAILMVSGLIKFPWGGAGDQNALITAVVLIMFSVACAIRGRKNKRGASDE